MSEELIFRSAFENIRLDFAKTDPICLDEGDFDNRLARLHEALRTEILQMIWTRREALLGILYRIDVDEREAQSAFGEPTDEARAGALSQLIIERQLRKARTRMKFQSPPD